MKLSIKILLSLAVIITLMFILVYVYLVFAGRIIFSRELEAITKRRVTLNSFIITPPFNIRIKDINAEGFFKADYITASPSFLYLLGGKLCFGEIKAVNSEITLERFPKKKSAEPAVSNPQATVEIAAPAPASAPASVSAPAKNFIPVRNLRAIFKHIKIVNGKINFIDHTVGKKAIEITIKNINFNLTNLYLVPRSAVANFEFSGNIPWQKGQEEGKVTAEGWIDLYKKDIRAVLKIEGIDGIYLYPYYAQWVDLQNSRIEKAKLNFTSNIHGLNNDVAAENHLELSDIVFKPRSAEEEQKKAEKIAYAVLDIFKALNQGKIILDFTIHTKMDNPRFGMADLTGAIETKLVGSRKNEQPLVGNIFIFPIKLLEGTVKATTDLSKAAIDGAFAIGNEFKKAVEGSFKK